MAVLLESWKEVAASSHLIICTKGTLSEETKTQILHISGLSNLPELSSAAGGTQVFFDQTGSKKISLVHCYSGSQGSRNQNLIRNVLFRAEQGQTALILDTNLHEITEDICIAGLLSTYQTGQLKTKPTNKEQSLGIFSQLDEQVFQRCENAGKAIKMAMLLVDTPPNIKTPDYIVSLVKEQFDLANTRVEVMDKAQLEEKGFEAILGVGQASMYGTYLIRIDYTGNDHSNAVDLVLAGKGVTFDTGGISLKDPTNMHFMKSDLGGAAAVLGAMHLIIQNALPVNITALVPVVENAIDNKAMRPGDVIRSYGGHTIEVIDTDAEGRLILADALSYAAREIRPEYLLDLATLTGNCVAALGYSAAGLFTNNPVLADQLQETGDEVGERCWPMPMYEEYGEMMESDIADIKNFHGKPIVGAITAAKFLEFFTEKHENWAHLDIAGVAFGDVPFARSKMATGYGVRLLHRFVEKFLIKA